MLGRAGPPVFPIAFGAWAVGGGWGAPPDRASARRAIARARELGITLFDTAPTYGDGESERALGEALAPPRDDLYIATKCGPQDDPTASLEGSLRRLRADAVDVLQLHEVPRGRGVLERRVEHMQALVDRGLTRAIGICNASASELERALAVAPLATYQGPLNAFDRDAEYDALPLARDRGLGVLAYRPLASGLLTGKYREPPVFGPDDHRRRIWWFAGREFARRRRVLDALAPLAAARGRSLAQLALAWVLARPGVTAVLAGARSAAQVEENVGAIGALDHEDVAAIDDIIAGAYPPRALRRGVSVAVEPARGGDHTVRDAHGRTLAVGEREAYVMRRLDGRTSYAAIAAGWRGSDGRALLIAQVVLLVDQLGDLGLLEDA